MLGFDDHPGQLYRLWHVMNYGPAPWAWDRGWWAGYPELQFYPPGFAYLGALLAWATTGVLDVGTVYQALLWLAYLLPGVTTYVVLARLTGLRWLALAGAFGALLLAAALTAFWTLPLLLRLAETRALAWGTLSLGEVARPLPIVLAALAVAGLLDRTPAGAGERLALWWLPAMVVATALDRLAAEPLGIRWLPADRIVDGAWIALVVAGGVGAARLARRLDAMPIMQRLGVSPRSPAFGLGAAALFALLSLGSDTLMLRPGAAPSRSSRSSSTAARSSANDSRRWTRRASRRWPTGWASRSSSRWRTTSHSSAGWPRARPSGAGFRWRPSSSSHARARWRCRPHATASGAPPSLARRAAGRARASPTIRSGARTGTARRSRRAAAPTGSSRCGSRARSRR